MSALEEHNCQPGTPILEVKDLSVSFSKKNQTTAHEALAAVNLELASGETVGLLGESGSGKSTLAFSILRALPPEARITGGSILFQGQNLLGLSHREMRRIRGAKIAIIFQEPGLALNPVLKAGTQITEVLRAHNHDSRSVLNQRAKNLL